MKKLAEFSVNYPISVLMLVLAVFLLGYISFQKLGVDLFPELNNPRLYVEIKAGERPPEEIEKQFVENIESLAIRQKKAVQVSSLCRVGSAQVIVEYAWEADMDEAFLDLQKSLTTFNQNGELDELNITQHDPNAQPIMIIGLSHPQVTDMDELRKVSENYLRSELVRLEGVAEVELLGQEEKEVVIETNDYLMDAYGLTPSTIVSRINSYNRNASGGSITEMGRKYVIKGVGEFRSVQDIENVIVSYKTEQSALANGTSITQRVPVFLRDVASLQMRNKDPENIVRIQQKRCMALAVYKETRYNTIKAVQELNEALNRLRSAMPGYSLDVIQNQGEFIVAAVNEVKSSALVGILLAVAVLYVFLRNLGVTLIISAAIPISIVATFNLMYFNGLTLNLMTLGGLALGAGMLVDNAIVVMENIFRNVENGLTMRQASIEGASQVGGAIVGVTLTTVVVFLPIIYLHGSAGELFKDQAWTVTFSLLASMVVSLVVLPMLSSRFIKTSVHSIENQAIRFPWYRAVLEKILNHKKWYLLGSLALLGIGYLLMPYVGSEFMPRPEFGAFSIEVRLPDGTSLARTEQTVVDIETMLQQTIGKHVQTLYSRIGPSTTSTSSSSSEAIFEDENTATIKVLLHKNKKYDSADILAQVNRILAGIPELEAQVIQEQTAVEMSLGMETAPIVIEIIGQDLTELRKLTEMVKEAARTIPELTNLESSFDQGRPEIQLVVDRNRAGLLNVNLDNVTYQLQDVLMGKDAGQWDFQGEMQNITLRLPKISVQELSNLVIDNSGQKVRLDEIAEIKSVMAPREISRRNQSRISTVSAHLAGKKPFDQVVGNINKKLHEITFPAEYRYEITGEEKKREESFGNLQFALILSIILVYMVMAAEFESLLHPLTILLTIPLAAVGTIITFFFAGMSFNMMAYIGLIMLGGIAVDNAIVLVDAVTHLRNQGMPVREALLTAGVYRIRPILTTSLTTILGMLPLCFGFGEGVALRAPLALAVIGGLATSTLMSLAVIPCVYEALENVMAAIKRR
jgi:hydrophobic/amphiphilic exporter-1 (mainly G- bacteria), HAE1 family